VVGNAALEEAVVESFGLVSRIPFFGSTDCGGRVSAPAVGLFDKKLLRTSDLFEAKGIKGPPHLAWEADYGEKRLRDLTIGTRELLGLIESTKASTGRDRVPTVSIRERLG
jgi:hypothetical protein